MSVHQVDKLQANTSVKPNGDSLQAPITTRSMDSKKKVESIRENNKPTTKLGLWQVAGLLLVGVIGGITAERLHEKTSPTIIAVNGHQITEDVLFESMQTQTGSATMEQLIQSELQLQYAKSLGLLPSDKAVDDALTRRMHVAGFQDRLVAADQTLSDYKRQLRVRMAQSAVMGAGIVLSPADIQQYYQEQTDPSNEQAAYYTPATCSISVIISDDSSTADKAYQDLLAGSPFDVVARKYSEDDSASNGGVIPTLVYGRGRFTTEKAMQDAFFNLKIGEIMPPRQFGGVWWVVRCMARTSAHTDSFQDVKDDCVLGAVFEKGQSIHGNEVNADFGQFARSANVQSFWPQYNSFSSS